MLPISLKSIVKIPHVLLYTLCKIVYTLYLISLQIVLLMTITLVPVLVAMVFGDELREFFLNSSSKDKLITGGLLTWAIIAYIGSALKIIDLEIKQVDEVSEKIDNLFES